MLDTVIFDERRLEIVPKETFNSVIFADEEVNDVVSTLVEVIFEVDKCSDKREVFIKLVIVPFVDCKSVDKIDEIVALVPFRLLNVEFSTIKLEDVKLTVWMFVLCNEPIVESTPTRLPTEIFVEPIDVDVIEPIVLVVETKSVVINCAIVAYVFSRLEVEIVVAKIDEAVAFDKFTFVNFILANVTFVANKLLVVTVSAITTPPVKLVTWILADVINSTKTVPAVTLVVAKLVILDCVNWRLSVEIFGAYRLEVEMVVAKILDAVTWLVFKLDAYTFDKVLLEARKLPVETNCDTIFVDVIFVNSVSVAIIEALEIFVELIVEAVMSPDCKEAIVANVDSKLLVVIYVLKIEDVVRLVIFA